MVTVALLGFIIVGLVGMFVQTQRAFRGGMAQSDVLEAGRATTDLLAREIEETSAVNLSGVFNFYATNWPGAVQSLSGTGASRANELCEFFFITRNNLTWTGNGFMVAPVMNNVGTLYSYQTAGTNNPAGLAQDFENIATDVVNNNVSVTNYSAVLHRVADGIVHLRVQTYSSTPNNYTTTSELIIPNSNPSAGYYNTNYLGYTIYAQISNPFGQTYCSFTGNAVPAYVDLELGVLEHETLEKFNALPPAAQQAYLERAQTAGRVHIFRRHIPIHNVDPAAYQ